MPDRPKGPLRRGWTTGACATAAASAAYGALLTGRFTDPVTVALPGGERPAFALAQEALGCGWARAGVVKDAGDDPDVTHGALVLATVRLGAAGTGVAFRAGEGVGTVTLPGLPLPPREPAINPVPRAMMCAAMARIASRHGAAGDVEIEISVPGGARRARKTWNPRLGIVGGLSILGTTGIVVPYSCSAWIHSIQRGVDVARAGGLAHIAGCTGSTSERAVRALFDLPEIAMIDMGDFAGGLLKYVRRHPVPRLSVGGGFAKICKLAEGRMDLHSKRGAVDRAWLAARLAEAGGAPEAVAMVHEANTAGQVLEMARAAGVPLADLVAARARAVARKAAGPDTRLGVVIVDRAGAVVGRADG
ncbi:MAG: cobalt-precorrin-5B (C(1))-methyltransferase [Kiloniellaceae bacterium]